MGGLGVQQGEGLESFLWLLDNLFSHTRAPGREQEGAFFLKLKVASLKVS